MILQINAQAFPYPPYSAVFDFKQVYFIMLPQFLVLGFIFIVPSIIRNVVSEKETGIKVRDTLYNICVAISIEASTNN